MKIRTEKEAWVQPYGETPAEFEYSATVSYGSATSTAGFLLYSHNTGKT